MNIMRNKMDKKLLCSYVTRRMENDVTQRSIQILANAPAKIR